jgi:tetratricopeptide (TPR) repeat protein
MGDYSLAQHKLDESALYLERLSASEEFDRGSWLHLAGKYAFATGNYPTAIAYFEQALAEAEVDWLIRHILVLLPKMAAYACEGDLDACASTAEAASSALGVLNASSMNRIFTMTTQEILKAFPNDTRLQSLMRDAQHHLPLQASS